MLELAQNMLELKGLVEEAAQWAELLVKAGYLEEDAKKE
jgi:hypothetical protein